MNERECKKKGVEAEIVRNGDRYDVSYVARLMNESVRNRVEAEMARISDAVCSMTRLMNESVRNRVEAETRKIGEIVYVMSYMVEYEILKIAGTLTLWQRLKVKT